MPAPGPGAPLYVSNVLEQVIILTPSRYQEWIDLDNQIYTLSQGCQTPHALIQGETYTSPIPFVAPPAGQPAQRSTITVSIFESG